MNKYNQPTKSKINLKYFIIYCVVIMYFISTGVISITTNDAFSALQKIICFDFC